jgi:hypothetical protein
MAKFLLVFAAVIGSSVCGMAQQQSNLYKLGHPPHEKDVKSAPMTKPANVGAASSRNLQSIERENSKTTVAAKSKPAPVAKVKPIKDKPTPPINFGEAGGAKKAGTVAQAPNPLQGRLKQKHTQN